MQSGMSNSKDYGQLMCLLGLIKQTLCFFNKRFLTQSEILIVHICVYTLINPYGFLIWIPFLFVK